MRLLFADFTLDTRERLLLRNDTQVNLEPKVFDCIALLACQAGNLTSVEQLRSALWPGVHVGDGALRRIINAARKALGDSGESQRFIRTRKRLGYVFVAPVARGAEASEPFGEWPFVGRARELLLLRDWIAEGQRGGLCFVSGEAGAGKSTFLDRLKRQPEGSARWLFGYCRATPGPPAFWPFRELAAGLAQDPMLRGQALTLAAKSPAVLQLVPELGGKNVPDWSTLRPDSRFELYQTLARLFGTLAQSCPLVLVIEDVHWADRGSIALLEAIAEVARQRPLRVFASYRPEAVVAEGALSRLIGQSSGRGAVFSVHLAPLAVEDLSRLLSEVGHPVSPSRAAPSLLRITGGNALYVHELVRHLLATGASLETALPPSLHHIIAARLRSLPDVTQERLGQAAILGEDFSLPVLSEMAASTRDGLARELRPAQHSGLLRASSLSPLHMQFSHALVCDALTQRLSPEQRRAYHAAALHARRAVAEAGASGELAMHAFEAGEDVPAPERRGLCEQAGREAWAAQLYDRALLHLGRALELAQSDEPTLHTAELTLLWARACWHADEPEQRVEAAFLQAAQRAREADAPLVLAEAALGYALGDESSLSLRIAALRPEALELAEEALQGLARDPSRSLDSWPNQVVYRLVATLSWLRAEGELAASQRAAERALRLAPEQLEPTQRLWLLALRAIAEPAQAARFADEIVARVQQPGLEPRRCIEILVVAMAAYLGHGELARYDSAAEVLSRLVELLAQPARSGRAGERMSIYLSLPLCVPLLHAITRRRLLDAERLFWQIGEQVRQLGLTRSRESDHDGFHILLQLYGYLGRSSALAPLVAQRLRESPESRWFCALLHAQFALERGDRSEAAAHFAQLRASGFRATLGERRLVTRPETLLRLSDLCVEVGTPEDAALLYQALLARGRFILQDGIVICLGSCARPLGALALQCGRLDAAERHYRAALAQNQQIGHRPEHARAQLGLAQLLRTQGRSLEARALAASAGRDAEEMNMAPTLARANALLAG